MTGSQYSTPSTVNLRNPSKFLHFASCVPTLHPALSGHLGDVCGYPLSISPCSSILLAELWIVFSFLRSVLISSVARTLTTLVLNGSLLFPTKLSISFSACLCLPFHVLLSFICCVLPLTLTTLVLRGSTLTGDVLAFVCLLILSCLSKVYRCTFQISHLNQPTIKIKIKLVNRLSLFSLYYQQVTGNSMLPWLWVHIPCVHIT